jgi:hypothetical protein
MSKTMTTPSTTTTSAKHVGDALVAEDHVNSNTLTTNNNNNHNHNDLLKVLICSANVGNAEPTVESMNAWIPKDGSVHEVVNANVNVNVNHKSDTSAAGGVHTQHQIQQPEQGHSYFTLIVIGMQEASFDCDSESSSSSTSASSSSSSSSSCSSSSFRSSSSMNGDDDDNDDCNEDDNHTALDDENEQVDLIQQEDNSEGCNLKDDIHPDNGTIFKTKKKTKTTKQHNYNSIQHHIHHKHNKSTRRAKRLLHKTKEAGKEVGKGLSKGVDSVSQQVRSVAGTQDHVRGPSRVRVRVRVRGVLRTRVQRQRTRLNLNLNLGTIMMGGDTNNNNNNTNNNNNDNNNTTVVDTNDTTPTTTTTTTIAVEHYGGDTKRLFHLVQQRLPSYKFVINFLRGQMRLMILVRDVHASEITRVECKAENTGLGQVLANKVSTVPVVYAVRAVCNHSSHYAHHKRMAHDSSTVYIPILLTLLHPSNSQTQIMLPFVSFSYFWI